MGINKSTHPPEDIVPLTPHDTDDIRTANSLNSDVFPEFTNGLYLPVGGAVKIKTATGSDRTLTLLSGMTLIKASQVFSTGTAVTVYGVY